MKIKSNGLVKVLVPAILVGGGFIAVKSYNGKPQEPATQSAHSQRDDALKNLSPQELKALGIEGDTPQDTLKTIVGSLNAVRQQQDSLNKQNARLLDENEKLRERNTNVSGQVNEAVQGVEKSYHERESQMRQQQNVLTSKINELTNKLQNAGKGIADKAKGTDSDIPLGLGLDGMGAGGGNAPASGSDGLMWVTPQDSPSASSAQKNGASDSSAGGSQFPTSFLSENALTKQKGSYEQQVKGSTAEKDAEEEAEPVYTLPENSTLIGSRAMTALLGRVPINGTVTDPYPFKVLIGKDNLTANGIELPDVEGAIVSGTASGDWTLSCVRGQVNSVTFVFTDGTVRTLPKPDRSGKGGNNSNQNGGKETGTSGGIGWISDENGIPCISGTRKSNASSYLPTIGLLGAAGAAGDAIGQNQTTSQTNAYGGVTSTLNGTEQPNATNLAKLKTGSLPITAGVIRALQRDPDNAALTARLAGELAMADTVETALIMRRMIVTGMSEPNAAAQNAAIEEGDRRVAAIDREITALRNEMELKRELSRNSVLTIIERENGRVNSNPQTQSDDSTDNRINRMAVPETENN